MPTRPNGSEEPTPQSPPPPALDWPDLATKDPPDRRWALRGWIGYGHTTLLVGQGGIGKTLIAQQIASALALGTHFIDDIDGPARVLMWACEDDHDELWRRQVAIAAWLDAGLDAFTENLAIVPRHGHDNALAVSLFGGLSFTSALLSLREQANDLGSNVIILDNAAQLYGGNENDRHSVTLFLNQLAGVLGPDRAILLLAHPSRSTGSEFSGSSAWEAVARTRLYLGSKLPDDKTEESEPDDNVRYLARRKANYATRDYRRFQYKAGVLHPDALETQGGVVGEIRKRSAEQTVIAALGKFIATGTRTTDGKTSPQYLPTMILEHKLAAGATKTELADATRLMLMDGRIIRGKVGHYSNRTAMEGLVLANT